MGGWQEQTSLALGQGDRVSTAAVTPGFSDAQPAALSTSPAMRVPGTIAVHLSPKTLHCDPVLVRELGAEVRISYGVSNCCPCQ